MKNAIVKTATILSLIALVGCGEEQPIEGKYGCYGLAEDVAECEKRAEASKAAKRVPEYEESGKSF